MRKISSLICVMICIASAVGIATAQAGTVKSDALEYSKHCAGEYKDSMDERIKYCTLVIKLSREAPNNGWIGVYVNVALLNRAVAYLSDNQIDLSVKDFDRFIQNDPSRAWFAYAIRAQLLLNHGQNAQAKADCVKAWQLDAAQSARFCRP
ncbi:MAG: hypothetical protein ABR929_06325 [Roseiarcus sp.]